MKKRAQKSSPKKPLPNLGEKNSEPKWRWKKTVRLNMDFQKIEDHPQTDLHFEVLDKIAQEPSPYDLLVREEKFTLFQEALTRLRSLSDLERMCIKLTMSGERLCEIAERLKIGEHAAQSYLSRGIAKVRAYTQKMEEEKNKF